MKGILLSLLFASLLAADEGDAKYKNLTVDQSLVVQTGAVAEFLRTSSSMVGPNIEWCLSTGTCAPSATGGWTVGPYSNNHMVIESGQGSILLNVFDLDASGNLTVPGQFSAAGGYYLGTTQIITNAGNLGNIGAISASGQITFSGLIPGTGGTVVCISGNVLYAGGCTLPGPPGYVTTSTGAHPFAVPIYTTASNIGPSSITDNGSVSIAEVLSVTNAASVVATFTGTGGSNDAEVHINSNGSVAGYSQVAFDDRGTELWTIYKDTANQFNIAHFGQNPVLQVPSTGTALYLMPFGGNVGIGVVPTHTLDVVGDINATSNINGLSLYVNGTQVINSARNLGNIVNIINSGSTTTAGSISGGAFYLGTTQIITAGGNLGNIGNGVFSGNLTAAGATFTGLTSGIGGTVVCINANVLYAGGCGTAYSGTGTANYLTKWTGTNAFGVSGITDNGTTVATSEAVNVSNQLSATSYYLGTTQIITAGGNLGNIVNIINSGNTTTGGNVSGVAYYLGTTQIITSTGNLGNIGAITASGPLTVNGTSGADLVTEFLSPSGHKSYIQFGNGASGLVELDGESNGDFNLTFSGGAYAVVSALRSGAVSDTLVLQGGNAAVHGNMSAASFSGPLTGGGIAVYGSPGSDMQTVLSSSTGYKSYFQLGPPSSLVELDGESNGDFNLTFSGLAYGVLNAVRSGAVGNTLVLQDGNASVAGWVKSINDLPDIMQYGCVSGMSDATSCINAAIAANSGNAVRIPAGVWNIGTGGGHITVPSNILIVGDGPGTTLWRKGNLSSSTVGLFDLANSSNVRITNLFIDGGVTTPSTKDYAAISGPLESDFTQNTTIWMHGGFNVMVDHVTIQHTGGYAAIVDATAYNANAVTFDSCTLQNNRSFLFGTGSDLTYGSWTGGILLINDGAHHNIQNFTATNNNFSWNSGNNLWMATTAPSATLLNKNVQAIGNRFQDIGLDGILISMTDGYTIEGNNFLRVGYVSTTDSTSGAAKWYNACTGGTVNYTTNPPTCSSGTAASIPAVAIDNSGQVQDFVIANNTVVAHNGGCIDLDGAGYGSISGNHCKVPGMYDLEYCDAQPNDPMCPVTTTHWGPAAGPGISGPGMNYMYGINTGNTNDSAVGGAYLDITGNSIYGQGGGGVRLYCGRYSKVESNHIVTASTIYYYPITIGPRASDPARQAYNNEVSNNYIYNTTGTGIYAVFEDSQYAAFTSGYGNIIHDNYLFGTMTAQLSKDANTSSIAYGASTTTSGSQSISQYLICNSQVSSTTNACVTNQIEWNGTNYLDRWYTPAGVLMATMSDDESFRIGNGALGSLWIGGNLALDVNRNAYLNSITDTASGTLVFDNARNFYGNSFSIGTYGPAFLEISSTGTISVPTTSGGYYVGSTQIITPTRDIGNIGNILGTGNLTMNGNVSGNSFYIYNPSGPGASQIAQIYDTGSATCTAVSPCANLGNISDITALGTVTAQTKVATPLLVLGGNPVYRCVTAGSLPVGALTVNAGDCGSIAPTGINSQ